MANQYFQFKQFTIHQENCAMKVTTDGCLFGAIASYWSLGNCQSSLGNGHLPISKNQSDEQDEPYYKVLDIGAGTGLLSLMLAQKCPTATIDAVEIDEQAAVQCQQNFDASPWSERLKTHCSSIQDFAKTSVGKYDIIISNPPFYEQQLKGPNAPKNMAHHSSGLSLAELFICAARLLKPLGSFIVLLPFYRLQEAIDIAEDLHLFPQQKILVKQTPKHDCFRAILIFSFIKKEMVLEETIVIKDERNVYTARFSELLGDCYLGL